MKKLLILTMTLAGLGLAQTTSSDPGPHYCMGESRLPPTSTYSFYCISSGGIVFPPGQQIVQFNFYSAHVEVWTDTWTPMPGNPWGDITSITNWVAPSGCTFGSTQHNACTTPGALAFTWEQPGSDGLTHTGTFSAVVNGGVYDTRGWFHPELTNMVVTVN